MQVQNRNIRFPDASWVIWEGSHTLLYKSGTDSFGKAMYNLAILAFTTWTPTQELYWKNYTTGSGAWGPNGIENLIKWGEEINPQAKLIHENFDDIEAIVRLCMQGKIRWQLIHDIKGYYVNENVGEYVGPNKHRGFVKL